MPIKPENRALYPPPRERRKIRDEVLLRAGNSCEFCGAPNRELILRDRAGKWHLYTDAQNMNSDEGLRLFSDEARPVQIVLTIAHLNHEPQENGEPGNRPNLAALCQRCHLRHDAKLHSSNARKTRNSKKGLVELNLGT